jgi:hypothetical protein
MQGQNKCILESCALLVTSLEFVPQLFLNHIILIIHAASL